MGDFIDGGVDSLDIGAHMARNSAYGTSVSYLEELGVLRRYVDARFDIETGFISTVPNSVERMNDSHYSEVETRVATELAALLGVSPEDVMA